MKEIFSRAPSRVDFSGGTLDLPFFAEREKGATLNCAVSKYGYSSLKQNNQSLEIFSLNYNKKIKVNFPIKYDKNLDLLKSAFKLTNFNDKSTLTTYHEMRPHSRLGTSSSIAVSALGAIYKYQNKKINQKEIAEIANKMEAVELEMHNGPQDQYSAALGGILMMRFNGKKVKFERVNLKKETVYELEKNIVLCYLNSEKVAGNVNYETCKGYDEGNERVVSSIRSIKQTTFDMYKSLKKGDMKDFATLLNQENSSREKLNKYIVTPVCKKYISIGLKNGASAAKILGSGAGGTLLFYAKENQRKKLIESLEKNKAITFDFRVDFKGVQAWEGN
jgi:D-glycero-alpha-D-manno-heptose-7-phosphate kinase